MDERLNILQVNISGLQNKKEELEQLLLKSDIRVAVIQETILPKKPVHIKGYTQYPASAKTDIRES